MRVEYTRIQPGILGRITGTNCPTSYIEWYIKIPKLNTQTDVRH